MFSHFPILFFSFFYFFFLNDTATTEIYTLSLHDALPLWDAPAGASDRSHPGRHVMILALSTTAPAPSNERRPPTQDRQGHARAVVSDRGSSPLPPRPGGRALTPRS